MPTHTTTTLNKNKLLIVGPCALESLKHAQTNNQQLNYLREKIDHIDQQLLENFAQRFQIVEQIGQYKHQNGLPTLDKNR